MNNDFSHPQRQSLIGVVVMFADTLQVTLRAFWPILVVYLFKINDVQKLYLWVGIPAILLLVIATAYLKYWNFTFFLDEDNEEFVVRKGIWNKSRIAIPLDKIQQVNINQSFIQRLIGVHALEVDTAGSNGKEVSIRAIKESLAISLKERLLEGGKDTITNNNIAEEGETALHEHNNRPFIKISLLSLLKTGITSNYMRSFAVLVAFMITIIQNLEEFLDAAGYQNHLDDYLNAKIMLQFVTIIIGTIIFLTLMVNLVRTIIRYYDFRITKQQNGLLLSYGLLNTKNTIIRAEKVQVVTVGRNYFQKKFNINDLKIRQASGNEANDREQKMNHIEIPGCNNNEKDVLLQFLLAKVPERGLAVKPNFRKMIFASFRFLLFPAIAFYVYTFFSAQTHLQNFRLLITDFKTVLILYILFAGLMVYFSFRNSRLFVSEDFIIKQSGAWDIDNDYIAPHKIQTISLKQFFWQKGSDVGIVTLHTAGGTISFGLASFTMLKQLANYWLYQVETGGKHWM